MIGSKVCMINQLLLPYRFEIYESSTFLGTVRAIRVMIVRGAGAIGAAAGFAMAQACMEAPSDGYADLIAGARKTLESSRPTARDLFAAVEKVYLAGLISPGEAVSAALQIADKNASDGRQIGEIGQQLIHDGCRIQTHCNAGWLGLVDYGSALAPVYLAHRSGKRLHVWINETRPRNQGARLTAWELLQENIPCTVIADNAAAHLMSRGETDLVIVGADRIALNGDVANKIGTLSLAIAAREFRIPFYVAAPTSTIDISSPDGGTFNIEERDPAEVLYVQGILRQSGTMAEVSVGIPGMEARNPAFDVTPSGLITGILTEKGIITPERESILGICKHKTGDSLSH
jgi:S-methyl-5-thioribose-1-phosphate isomerase